MQAKEIVNRLEPWIASHRRAAWNPLVDVGEGPATISKFGGLPWISRNAPWPECANCRKPLLLFLQLDLGDVPAELGRKFGTGLLQLFYCTREECQGFGGWEPFEDSLSRVRVVQQTTPVLNSSEMRHYEQIPAKRIVNWNRFIDVPSPEEHDGLGLKYNYDFRAGTLRLQCPELEFDVTYPMNDCPAEKIAVSKLGDKLAGWPHWIQGVEYPNCRRCGRRMEHVFQIDSEHNIPFMFGDAGCGHITQCPDHKEVVAFGWACS